jgi:hypothetical protein
VGLKASHDWKYEHLEGCNTFLIDFGNGEWTVVQGHESAARLCVEHNRTRIRRGLWWWIEPIVWVALVETIWRTIWHFTG